MESFVIGALWNALLRVLESTTRIRWKAPQRIRLKSLAIGTLCKVLQRILQKALQNSSIGKRSKCISLKPPRRDSIGMPQNWNPLDSTPKGFCWKASQEESFGKHHKGIRLERLAIGTLCNVLQQISIRNHNKWTPLEPFKGVRWESLRSGILWNTLQRGSAGRPHN